MDEAAGVALITGASRRIGAEIVRVLHDAGLRIALHFHRSAAEAEALAAGLNSVRPDSVLPLQADLNDVANLPGLIEKVLNHWGRLDALVNNASTFYPTPLGEVTISQWDELLSGNLRAPFFLTQAAAPTLKGQRGAVVNLVDIYAERPLRFHTVYSIAKAGLAALTRSLAVELAPEVRVNGVAPGAILWPEQRHELGAQAEILGKVPLARAGNPSDIARAVRFLLFDAPYVTGQILAVDGGRSLFI
jgi:pteridine reductase